MLAIDLRHPSIRALAALLVGCLLPALAGASSSLHFGPAMGSPLPLANYAEDVDFGDFDGDGDLDIAVADGASGIAVWLNMGGAFAPAPGSPFPVDGIFVRGLAIDDFDGDGRDDVATVRSELPSQLYVFRGRADGALDRISTPRQVGSLAWHLVAGDFDGDSRADLAVASASSDSVSVLRGIGNGTFGSEQIYPVGDDPVGLAASDFDSDGDIDLVVANHLQPSVSVLRNSGDGDFVAGPSLDQQRTPTRPFLADFDGNGTMDLAVANWQDNRLGIRMQQPNGSFVTSSSSGVLLGGSQSIAVGDLDRDGLPDVIDTSYPHDWPMLTHPRVLLSRPDATFSNRQLDLSNQAGISPRLADLNGDDLVELVFVDARVVILTQALFADGFED